MDTPGQLSGKTALVTGIANKRSLAYAIAQDFADQGADLAITYQPVGRDQDGSRIREMCADMNPALVEPLAVDEPASITALVEKLRQQWGRLDVLVHAIASAKREELNGRYSDTSLEGFLLAHQISAYSMVELVRATRPLMVDHGGSILTLTYIGSERATTNYNVMGAAKASLEAGVRYMAMELGGEGIRVNAVSAGPVRTLSASGVRDFLNLLHNAAEKSALKRNITAEEVAHAATFLASDRASGITGQVMYVDGGFNIYG